MVRSRVRGSELVGFFFLLMTKSSRIRKDKAIYEVHSNDSRLWHHLLQWPARDPEPQDNWNSASKASNYRAPASCSIHCSSRVKRGQEFSSRDSSSPHPAPHRVGGPFPATTGNSWPSERHRRVPFSFCFGVFLLRGPGFFFFFFLHTTNETLF